MEALLCDEVWFMSPPARPDHNHKHGNQLYAEKSCTVSCFYATKEDCENALKSSLHKEINHMPQEGYVERLESNQFLSSSRFKAIQWLLQSKSRFALSFGTVFSAANYFDCFISMIQCHEWKHWIFELVSVACLSIACKFGETAPPSFHEMQEGLDYVFEPKLIQRMELTVLKAIGWGLNCVTPYSYVELMTWEINVDISIKRHLVEEFTSQLIELLANTLLDYKLLAFRPSIIALTGFKSLPNELLRSTSDAHNAHIMSFIPQDQRENLVKCKKLFTEEMRIERFDHKLHAYGQSLAYCPSSPVTVLTKPRVEIYEQQVDFSLFKIPASMNNISLINSVKKRKRDDEN